LIVTTKMPCRRESNGRHATIPDDQKIIILNAVAVRMMSASPLGMKANRKRSQRSRRR
jgi:hypothetical protein